MRSVEVRRSVVVRPYRDEDLDRVLELLDVTLGAGPAGSRPAEFFRWKHLENPAGRSFMLVAELDGSIVGFRAFMRWRFVADGSIVRAVRAVDTATHPDHQGKGIFKMLTLQALDALRTDTDLVFNTPNDNSLPGYLKMGWRTVGRMPVWIRVRRPIAFARGLRSIRTSTEPKAPRPDAHAEPAAVVFEEARAFVGSIEATEASGPRLSTPLDVDYLSWRYGRAPLLGYQGIVDRRDGEVSGIAFFRVRPRGGLWETTLGDVIVRPDDTRTASRLIGNVIAASKVHHLTAVSPAGSVQLRALRRHGFLPWRRGEVLVVNPLHASAELAAKPENWDVSLGTLEVF